MPDTASSMDLTKAELSTNWPIVLGVFTCLMFSVGSLVLYSYGVFAPELMGAFGWSRAEVAGGILAHNLGIVLGAPLSGYLADRYGGRIVILISVVIFSALWASLYVLSPPIWNFYAVLAAIPIIAGGAMPIAYSKIVVGWFDRQRGLALGLSLAGVGVGATIIPPLTQALIGEFGWREAYLSLAFLALVIPLPMAFLLLFEREKQNKAGRWLSSQLVAPELATAPKASAATNTDQKLGGSVIGSRALWVMMLFFLVTGVALTAAIVNLVPILSEKGLTRESAAMVASVMGIAVIGGRVIIGLLLDRVAARIVIAGVCLGPALAFLVLAYGEGVAIGILAAALLGFAVGAEVDIMAYLVSRFFPPGLFGRLYGLMFSAFVIGGAIGPLLVGYLRDSTGTYDSGLLGMSAIMALSILIILALPPQPKEAPSG